MLKRTFVIITFVLSTFCVSASDWGGSVSSIERLYIYPNAVIVIHGAVYKGEANCAENNGWAFYWNDFDPVVAERIHSTLLAAYMSKAPFRAIFHPTECGPEGKKKFIGSFAFN